MKVLLVQNIAAIAGSENYILAITPELVKKGVEVHFLNIHFRKDEKIAKYYNSQLEANDVVCHSLVISRYQSIKPAIRILKLVRANQIDIVHSHLIYSDFWTALAKMFNPRLFKAVSTLHAYQENLYVKYNRDPVNLPKTLYYYLQLFCNEHFDVIYACSYGLRDFYSKSGLDKKKKIKVIQHGFDYREIDKDVSKFRKGEPQICVIGRLIERKGHQFLLGIMPDLVAEFPNLKLLVAGSGDEEDLLKRQAKNLNVWNNLEFLGYSKQSLEIMKASDIVVVPSYAEGLPLVIFEAFHSGTPVIAFDTIGCGEAVKNGETGVLIPAFNVDQLREQIIALLVNPDERIRISINAQNSLKDHFNLQRMVHETFSIYKNVQID